MSSNRQNARRLRRGAAAGIAVAGAFSMAIGWRNYFVYRSAGRPMPLWEAVAGELPIWFGWLALVPLIAWLARRWPPVGPHAVRNTFVHAAAALLLSAVMSAFIPLARLPLPNTPSPFSTSMGLGTFWLQVYLTVTFSFLFVYASIAGLALALQFWTEEQRRKTRESRTQTLLVQAERDLLRTQLHPHFLFNTMHAISALMSTDVPAARQMMIRLSDLLRQTLDDTAGHEATLEEELEFLSRYVDIQLVRFNDRLRVEYRIDDAAKPLLVPRLILQPIAENAVSHGLAPLERAVTICIEAVVEDEDLVITVSDDGAGLSAHMREGLGIGNSRARLQQLYGSAATLTLEQQPIGARTTIRLPAHHEPVDDVVAGQTAGAIA